MLRSPSKSHCGVVKVWPEKKGGRKRNVAGNERWPKRMVGRKRKVDGKERWPEKTGDRKRKVA